MAPLSVGAVFDDLLAGVAALRVQAEAHSARLELRLAEAASNERDPLVHLRPFAQRMREAARACCGPRLAGGVLAGGRAALHLAQRRITRRAALRAGARESDARLGMLADPIAYRQPAGAAWPNDTVDLRITKGTLRAPTVSD